jgi:hypothetical protein
MNTNILTPEIKTFIINYKMDSLRNTVNYYKSNYLPELKSLTGYDKAEHIERANEKLNNFYIDVQYYNKSKNFDYLTDIQENDILQSLRLYAVTQKEQAEDFKDNIYIVGRCLRESVKAINILKEYKPQLKIYSNKYLASRKVITI